MKVERRPREEFEKFADKPVTIKPFDPASKAKSNEYRMRLNEILAPFQASAELHGSVELEVAGKGEWEFAIYLNDDQ